MKVVGLVAGYLVLLLAGQLLWKKGLALDPGAFQGGPWHILYSLGSSWHIVAGILIYGLATLIWLYLLSRYALSYIYPVTSLSFVLALFVSIAFLGENVPWNRWLGVLVICAGVYLVSLR